MSITLQVEPISKDAFSPYGQVIDNEGEELSSSSKYHDYWDGVAEFHPEGRQVCSLLKTKKNIDELIVEMEQHRLSEEILVALDGDIIVTVAHTKEDKPDENTVRSFLVKKGIGVVFKAGIWHALPVSYGKTNMMLVVFKENTSFSKDKDVPTDIRFKEINRTIRLDA